MADLDQIRSISYNKNSMSDVTEKIISFFQDYPLRTFEKHQIIIRPDSPVTKVFYIVDGRVDQYDITQAGNEVVVNVFKPGAFFPMSSAINATPNPYYFEASTPVRVRIAPVTAAMQFLHDNPDVTFDLLSRVYRGTDGVLRRMAHLMGGDASHRLLFELLNAARRFGEPQKNGSVYIPLKENELATHSGLARETINRHMQQLKSNGLVEVSHTGITITDISKLQMLLGNEV